FADGSIGSLTYCTVGSKSSGGERVEIFAQGVGAFSEDFKRVGVHKGMRTSRSKMWPDKGYAAQMSDFATSIREGRAPAVTVYDGARATLGCLAMMKSARQQAPVAIVPANAL
ncbi:MAG: oxidoreductase domain protein, partial [Candidatus Solibacter sp.]|nr:oxidoreductase domain protein [Candidatus Solibacter sp.]